MSEIEDLDDSIPNIKGDPCLDGRRRAMLKTAERGREAAKVTRQSWLEGNRLRMSQHTPSLPKLKFLEGEGDT